MPRSSQFRLRMWQIGVLTGFVAHADHMVHLRNRFKGRVSLRLNVQKGSRIFWATLYANPPENHWTATRQKTSHQRTPASYWALSAVSGELSLGFGR
jgi:hypothetical protein